MSKRSLREDLVMAACLEAYGAVRHEGRLADRALDHTLRAKKNLYSTERRAVAERVYGLLRRQLEVDWLLEHARRDFHSLKGSSQDVLRLAVAELLEGGADVARELKLDDADADTLARIPAAQAALDKLPAAKRFPIRASLPEFLAAKIKAELGSQAELAMEAMNQRAPLTARVNTLKATRDELQKMLEREGVRTKKTPLSPLGLHLETRINAFSLAAFKEGYFELQDEGSQLLGMIVDAPPTRVIDACAGAGGKTLQLAAQMKNKGELYALDVDARRLEDLKKRTRRAGVHNVRIQAIPKDETADKALEKLHGWADRVLVDAPCSGTGTFRRKPDARYRLKQSDLDEHTARQAELLARFAKLLKPKGRLIYGTCSLLTEENEQIVDAFLKAHPDFRLEPATAWLWDVGPSVLNERGALRLYPHLHDTDGFFGAVLIKA